MTVRGGLLVYADPYTGNVLGSRRRDENVMVKVHQFHTSYLLGKTGQWITGISSIVLIVLGITGIWLWLKVRIVKIKFGVPWKRLNFDAHSAIGLYCSLFWLALGFTGVTIGFDQATRSVVKRVTGAGVVQQPPGLKSSRPEGGGRSISADDAVAAAARDFPGAAVTMINLPAGPAGTYGIALKYPEDRTPAGRSRMVVDRYSGKTLWAFNTRTAAARIKFLNVQRSIHTGDVFGWPTRMLACAASALLGLQVVTGLWIWWPVRRKRPPGSVQPIETDQLAVQTA
jgi:uncharacterized iron-regulated membrane protein